MNARITLPLVVFEMPPTATKTISLTSTPAAAKAAPRMAAAAASYPVDRKRGRTSWTSTMPSVPFSSTPRATQSPALPEGKAEVAARSTSCG